MYYIKLVLQYAFVNKNSNDSIMCFGINRQIGGRFYLTNEKGGEICRRTRLNFLSMAK